MAETHSKKGRGRRPAADVRADVLSATGTLLFEYGMQTITFERIAQESGVSKTTLYKWWPSPGAIAAEAFFARSEPLLEFPHTDDLRADLVAQLTAFVALFSDSATGRPIAELIGTAQLDPDVATAWAQSYALPRRELARARLRQAKDDGDLAPDADLDIMVDQLWGACYHRLLIVKDPPGSLSIPTLVDYALRAASGPSPIPSSR
ncbi:MAG: TetR/AcrR family transcriptional regulator C-terminal ligand-binding domain-containing protein [Mycetocola sp.]